MKYKEKYKKRSDLYKRFSNPELKCLDFSEEAIKELYVYESKGKGNANIHDRYIEYFLTGRKQNGYAVGKRNLDLTISMWKETASKPGWGFLLEELAKEYDIDFLKSVFSEKKYIEFLDSIIQETL